MKHGETKAEFATSKKIRAAAQVILKLFVGRFNLLSLTVPNELTFFANYDVPCN